MVNLLNLSVEDTTISTHPRRMYELSEVADALSKLARYKAEMGNTGVVVVRQNPQLGSAYVIVSEQEAVKKPSKLEFHVGPYYNASYFENLRQKLSQQ